MRFRIIILLIAISFCANAQGWDWAQHSPGDLNYSGKCIDEDALSNLYITGNFTGNITLGNFTLSSSTQSSYIAKVDPNGTYLWAKKLNCKIYDIAVENDIVIAGSFSDSLAIDQSTIISQDAEDAFLAKLDLSGNIIWLKQGKGTGNDQFKNIKRNSSGNIFITGTAASGLQVDNINLANGAFVIVFNYSGNIIKDIEICNNCTGWEVSSDENNCIYVLCKYINDVNIGGATFHDGGEFGSHFLAKYSDVGDFIWAKDLGENYYSYKNLRVTHNGEIYLSSDQRYDDIILTKFSTDGNIVWNKYFGGSVYDGCMDIELDDQENIYLTGGFWYEASYGGVPASGAGNCLFLAKLDSAGNGQWVKSVTADAGEDGTIYGMESSFKNPGHGYLLGYSLGNSQLDGQQVNGPFIAKLTFNTTTSVLSILAEENLISVFPNPSNGSFSVDLSAINDKNKNIRVFDNSGKCVYDQSNINSNNIISIDLKNLPKGIYSIELTADKKKWVKKMIVN